MKAKATKIVAAYIRVSTTGQNEAGQRAEIERWLTGNGIDPDSVRWFVDKGKSGDSLKRPAFEQLQAHYQFEIDPRGALQQTLFDELVAAAWNLRRVRILEAGIDLLDPLSDRLARHHAPQPQRHVHGRIRDRRSRRRSGAGSLMFA